MSGTRAKNEIQRVCVRVCMSLRTCMLTHPSHASDSSIPAVLGPLTDQVAYAARLEAVGGTSTTNCTDIDTHTHILTHTYTHGSSLMYTGSCKTWRAQMQQARHRTVFVCVRACVCVCVSAHHLSCQHVAPQRGACPLKCKVNHRSLRVTRHVVTVRECTGNLYTHTHTHTHTHMLTSMVRIPVYPTALAQTGLQTYKHVWVRYVCCVCVCVCVPTLTAGRCSMFSMST